MTHYACRECHSVQDADTHVCPICGSSSLSDDWAGFVVIAHPEQSEIAELMDITTPGRYALNVR
jgi:DNA-directed RNA polymerase subunit E"